MAGIANRYFTDYRINDGVHHSGAYQSQHRVEGVCSGKKDNAHAHANPNDRNTESSVEILLDVKVIVSTESATVDYPSCL